MGSTSRSQETTEFQTKEFPGLFGTTEGRRIGGQLDQLLGSQSVFGQQLQQQLTQPTFQPTEAERNLIQSAISGIQGQTAVRGLGPATAGAKAQGVAPLVQGLQGQRVSNLQQAFAQDVEAGAGQAEALLQLAELALPQILAGQTGTSRGTGVQVGGQIAQAFGG